MMHMTYKELLKQLQGLSEEQLAAPVAVVVTTADEKSGEKRCEKVDGEISLQISAYGLMHSGNGLVEDYLGCTDEDELAVRMDLPYLKFGDGTIMDNNVYGYDNPHGRD